jgi:2,4-dienoyl-CoA reductase-like NADH-dependent reductase (Old Yellow Enzyme family)
MSARLKPTGSSSWSNPAGSRVTVGAPADAVAANIWDDHDARGLALTAEAVHAHGALAGLELYHGGASS